MMIINWLKAIRIHQWVKNLLVLVPLLLAHEVSDADKLFAVVIAFVAFCLLASGNYLINDLLDRENDRRHPHKCHRPIASGKIAPSQAVIVAIVMIVTATSMAVSVSWWLFAILGGYLALTIAYSLWLKRVVLVDVFVLSSLYTIRVVAGGIAASVMVSPWFLAFSIFIFLSLGLVKRYAELCEVSAETDSRQEEMNFGRGYTPRDLSVLGIQGIAAGYAAVVILSLYINDPASTLVYQYPEYLWGIVIIMLYWVSRIWLLTYRGQMHHDPITFAITDKQSLLAGLLCVLVVAFASA